MTIRVVFKQGVGVGDVVDFPHGWSYRVNADESVEIDTESGDQLVYILPGCAAYVQDLDPHIGDR